jgi:hypothetical protein
MEDEVVRGFQIEAQHPQPLLRFDANVAQASSDEKLV